MESLLPMIAEYGPTAITAATTGYSLGKKYLPGMIRGAKSLANNLFSNTKRKSAMEYVKGLSKPKGWARLAQDGFNAAKGASNYIASGKAMKGINEVAGDAKTLLNASHKLIGDKYHSQASSAINRGLNAATKWHDVANQYNETGKQLANQFQNQITKRV